MIHTYIPYSNNFNLGKAYNDFMSIVDDKDWVLFLDHDATFTTREWYPQVLDIINNNPKYGAFTCMTNRVGPSVQRYQGIMSDNHDIRHHRKIGKTLQDNHYDEVIEFPEGWMASGVILLLSKQTWKTVGGFVEGFLGVDNCLHRDCKNNSIPFGLMKGFYVYHWYRAENDDKHVAKAESIHPNAYFSNRKKPFL